MVLHVLWIFHYSFVRSFVRSFVQCFAPFTAIAMVSFIYLLLTSTFVTSKRIRDVNAVGTIQLWLLSLLVGVLWASEERQYCYEDECYKFIRQSKTHSEADRFCLSRYHGNLLTILDNSKQHYIRSLLQHERGQYWIGGKLNIMDQWTWVDGTAFSPYSGQSPFISETERDEIGPLAFPESRCDSALYSLRASARWQRDIDIASLSACQSVRLFYAVQCRPMPVCLQQFYE